MSTCKDCLHYDVCEALENGNGIKKVHPIQCGCFKPKADYVEVVRCKDCKKGKRLTENGIMVVCHKLQSYRTLSDFCSYGERKESEVQGE